MNKQYYLRNIGWGLLGCCLFLWLCRNEPIQNYILISIYLVISTILYPYSKKIIEVIALTFTSANFWVTGFFTETALKSGVYAIYYTFCFIFVIPFGLIYVIFLAIKKGRT